MRAAFFCCVCFACTPPPVITTEGEGEGEGGEGEGEEGEGEGEGEGDALVQAPLPERACVVVEGTPEPGHAVFIEAAPPLVRAPGRVDTVVLDDGLLVFVAHRVGDVVFGDCFVHVAAPPGLYVELWWHSENNANDLDIQLAAAAEDGSFCSDGDVVFSVDGVGPQACADRRTLCDYQNCREGSEGAADVDFDGDGEHTDADPVLVDDARGGAAAGEHIHLPAPSAGTRLVASAHAYQVLGDVDDDGPEATLRAWLDDVLVGEARQRLRGGEVGAPLLIDVDAATCAGDDASVVCTTQASCTADLYCASFCSSSCSVVDGGCATPCTADACLPSCHDPTDASDGTTLASGRTDNVLCPGDVDVFTLAGAAEADVVSVSVTTGAVTLEDGQGVLDSGGFVRAQIRALPVVVRLENHGFQVPQAGEVVVVAIDSVAARCAEDEAFEPDDVTPRVASSRADGVLCPADDVDCVRFSPTEDRFVFLDILPGEELCLVDDTEVSGCAPDPAVRRLVNAGEFLDVCVRTAVGFPGEDWHLRSSTP